MGISPFHITSLNVFQSGIPERASIRIIIKRDIEPKPQCGSQEPSASLNALALSFNRYTLSY